MTNEIDNSKQIADLNLKVVETIAKDLGINLGDMITEYKSEAGFIAASIKSIVIKVQQHKSRKSYPGSNQSPA